MKTYSFEVPIAWGQAHTMFNDPRVLDAVHGRGLWDFDAWRLVKDTNDDADRYIRQGVVKGVTIPSFARFLNKGKKHIRCRVVQEYVSEDGLIQIRSSMHPMILRSDIATNKSVIRVQPAGQNTCLVECTSINSTSLPHPLATAAIETMDDMTDESMDFLHDALR
jgi:hypothetical protein